MGGACDYYFYNLEKNIANKKIQCVKVLCFPVMVNIHITEGFTA